MKLRHFILNHLNFLLKHFRETFMQIIQLSVLTNIRCLMLSSLLSRERQANERYWPRRYGEPGSDHRAEKRVQNGPWWLLHGPHWHRHENQGEKEVFLLLCLSHIHSGLGWNHTLILSKCVKIKEMIKWLKLMYGTTTFMMTWITAFVSLPVNVLVTTWVTGNVLNYEHVNGNLFTLKTQVNILCF